MKNLVRSLSLGASFASPLFAAAAGLTTIVPQNNCPLGYQALFTVVQNIVNDSVYLAIFVAVLLIAYAGFLFATNSAAPNNLSKANTVLIDTVIGFIIVLAAWLIVNEFVSIFVTGGLSSITTLLNPTSTSPCI